MKVKPLVLIPIIAVSMLPGSLHTYGSKLHLFDSLGGWAGVGGVLYKMGDGGRSFAQVLPTGERTDADIPGESQALKTSINGPTDLAFDNTGFVYLLESMQHRLLRLDVKHASIKVVLPEAKN